MSYVVLLFAGVISYVCIRALLHQKRALDIMFAQEGSGR